MITENKRVLHFEMLERDVILGYISVEYFLRRMAIAFECEVRPDVRLELERIALRVANEDYPA